MHNLRLLKYLSILKGDIWYFSLRKKQLALEAIVEPGVAAVAGSVITGLISINIAVIKWLVGKFAKVSDKIDAQYLSFNNQMDGHEVKDQSRHEENLYRFEKISVALAKLGSDNGTH